MVLEASREGVSCGSAFQWRWFCGNALHHPFPPWSGFIQGVVFPFTPQWEHKEKPHVVRTELWASLQLSGMCNLSSTIRADSCFSRGFMEWGNWLVFRCRVAHENLLHNSEMIASAGSSGGSSVWEPRCGLHGREPLSREGHLPWLSLSSLSLSLCLPLLLSPSQFQAPISVVAHV